MSDRYTKAHLEQLGFRFSPLFHEVELTVPLWDVPHVSARLRVSIQNGDQFIVARPAKGSFRNGYDYLMTRLPLKGIGVVGIKKEMSERAFHGGSIGHYCKPDQYFDMCASAINEARKMLRRME